MLVSLANRQTSKRKATNCALPAAGRSRDCFEGSAGALCGLSRAEGGERSIDRALASPDPTAPDWTFGRTMQRRGQPTKRQCLSQFAFLLPPSPMLAFFPRLATRNSRKPLACRRRARVCSPCSKQRRKLKLTDCRLANFLIPSSASLVWLEAARRVVADEYVCCQLSAIHSVHLASIQLTTASSAVAVNYGSTRGRLANNFFCASVTTRGNSLPVETRKKIYNRCPTLADVLQIL